MGQALCGEILAGIIIARLKVWRTHAAIKDTAAWTHFGGDASLAVLLDIPAETLVESLLTRERERVGVAAVSDSDQETAFSILYAIEQERTRIIRHYPQWYERIAKIPWGHKILGFSSEVYTQKNAYIDKLAVLRSKLRGWLRTVPKQK